MSEIRWCDEGLHAFSANDIRRQQYTNTAVNPVNGQREVIDICGPCLAIRGDRTTRALATVAEKVDDANTQTSTR